MFRLDGKVAVITGGASGIGRGTAIVLAQQGAYVAIADRDVERAQELARLIGDSAFAVDFDALNSNSIENMIGSVLAKFKRIDILHNNVALTAGAWAIDKDLLGTSLETWDLTIAMNLRSMVAASKVVIPHMIAQGGGSVINMSSYAAVRGAPSLTAYAASKSAVVTFTQYSAVQYGRQNVRSNVILPGTILTPTVTEHLPDQGASYMRTVPFHRAGSPADIGAAVAFLSSDEAAFINGQMIHVDGGMSAGDAEPWDYRQKQS